MTQPLLAITDPRSSGRLYRHPISGIEVPSVTTVIGLARIEPLDAWKLRAVSEAAVKNVDWLAYLLDRVGDEETIRRLANVPNKIANQAGAVGDEVHSWLEALAMGEELPEVSVEASAYIDAVKAWLDEYQPEWIAVEKTVFSGEVGGTPGYAGTFDFLVKIDGRLLLGDWKTSRYLHHQVAMQLGALARCPEMVDGTTGESMPMPQIDGAIAVHIRPGSAYHKEVPLADEPWNGFQGLLQAWWALRESDKWLENGTDEKAQQGGSVKKEGRTLPVTG